MKKLFAMAVALFTATAMFAQPEAGTFTLQPKAGIAISSTDADGTTSKVGFVGGVEAGYQICDPFALTLGVNYAQYGAKIDNSDIKQNLNYIAIPVLANYYVLPGLAIKAGVEPAIKVSANLSNGDASASISDGVKGVMLSIPVGASYEYKNVVLDARYNIGVTGLYDIDDSATGSALVLTLGYKFAL